MISDGVEDSLNWRSCNIKIMNYRTETWKIQNYNNEIESARKKCFYLFYVLFTFLFQFCGNKKHSSVQFNFRSAAAIII